jgi:hypothetical protein
MKCFFQKNIKISPMDYKPFKDEASWIRFKNASLPPLNLDSDHLIDINYVVANLDLDKIQRGWLYKILQDTIQAPQGKVTTSHIDQRYSKSGKKCANTLITQCRRIQSSKISTFLTSTRLHFIDGAEAKPRSLRTGLNSPASITKWQQGEEFTDNQLISFLNTCLWYT